MRVVSVIFIFALISGCSSIDNQILGNWHCENCSREKNLLILEDNRIFQSPAPKGSIQYEYDILDKGLIELNRVNPFFLFRWLRELYCVFTTCEQVFKYKLAKEGTLHIFWNGTEEIYRKVILGAKTTESTLSIAETMEFINNWTILHSYPNPRLDNLIDFDVTEISVKTEKCIATFTYKTRKSDERHSKLDLGSLNPNSIIIREDYGDVAVRATNNNSYIYFYSLAREDEDNALKKIEKALKSVITQCGGKDDLF